MKRKTGREKVGRDTGYAQVKASTTSRADGKTLVVLPRIMTVKQLSDTLGISVVEIIKHLMRNGVMASINQGIDFESASKVATDLGFDVQEEPKSSAEGALRYDVSEENNSRLQPRPAVVTIMGHVDHGKTKLLDAIRQTNVVDTEAGNITQHIGAYQVEVHGQKITFLDTPGHEAFTAMRARGAEATDIAVLVIAADDGVMPQTLEAIDHARAAGVPIVIAINKVDKPDANPERVKQQLTESGLLIEEWGGDIICVPVSAKRGDGIPDLLENLLIVAEIQELKANPDRPASMVVIEASLDSNKGTLATVLVQSGTLKIGDNVVGGDTRGRIKAMFDDKGKRLKKAGPSTPVEILGLNSVPQAGDILTVVGSEKEARIELERHQKVVEGISEHKAPTLSNIYTQIQTGQAKELNIILKTDVQGSLDPIKTSLERLGGAKAKVRIVRSGSGSITESDVMLAIASNGIIIGFNTSPEPGAKLLSESNGIDIRCYQVIYTLIEDVEKALAGLLEPTYVDVVEGHGEVRATFNIKQAKIAGVYITDGKLSRGALARIIRHGETIHDSNISSLKHFREDVRELGVGFECGVGIDGFSTFEVGDIIEAYRKEKKN